MAHREALAQAWRAPLAHPFGTLLAVKILLAASVLVHFVLAVKHAVCGSMTSLRFKLTHLSVLAHMAGIVILAKAMYLVRW